MPLKQLIPGTEDYYYYHCLHLQNTEQFDKVDELLQALDQAAQLHAARPRDPEPAGIADLRQRAAEVAGATSASG